MPKADVQKHWDCVASLGCIVTGAKVNVTLHHCHGASMKDRGVHRSFGRKTSAWLVIPLIAHLHVGDEGVDTIGPTRWEKKYGKQAEYLDLICEKLGVDVWAKAAEEERGMVRRAA